MPIELNIGARGEEVLAVKKKLTERMFLLWRDNPDDLYNEETQRAVRQYQELEGLVCNGIVETTTWNALMEKESHFPFYHSVNLVPQPDENSCWKACMQMITGKDFHQIENDTPRNLFDERGLYNMSLPSGMNLTDASIAFANAHGMRFVIFNSKPLCSELYGIIPAGPVMVEFEEGGRSRRLREAFNSHWVVIADMRGDDDSSGMGTVVRIYDPEPVNQGSVYAEIYGRWLASADIHRAFW
jgi:hypothetical protein